MPLCRRRPPSRRLSPAADLAAVDVDQLEAAAAEVAGHAVGILEAGDDAERREARFLGAGKQRDRHAADRLDLGDELGAVLRLARRRRREHIEFRRHASGGPAP